MSYRGRFAPSPTGPLHAGSLLAAWASWLRARQAGGRWLVRIEDLDPPREVPGAAQAQLRMLEALGMESDEAVVRQSARTARYEAALERLRAAGLAFACRCSRADLAAQGGVHRACAPSDPRRAPAWRARVPAGTVEFADAVYGVQRQALADEVGDFVLRRVDGLYAYQLAVVVDDAAQGITEVVRGADLLDSTPRQRWLQGALGLAAPAYVHLPLVLDACGHKLGKSQDADALDPRHPLPALRSAWRQLGQEEAVLDGAHTLGELHGRAVAAFDLARVPRSARGIPVGAPV